MYISCTDIIVQLPTSTVLLLEPIACVASYFWNCKWFMRSRGWESRGSWNRIRLFECLQGKNRPKKYQEDLCVHSCGNCSPNYLHSALVTHFSMIGVVIAWRCMLALSLTLSVKSWMLSFAVRVLIYHLSILPINISGIGILKWRHSLKSLLEVTLAYLRIPSTILLNMLTHKFAFEIWKNCESEFSDTVVEIFDTSCQRKLPDVIRTKPIS
jgi:hypothetical protein